MVQSSQARCIGQPLEEELAALLSLLQAFSTPSQASSKELAALLAKASEEAALESAPQPQLCSRLVRSSADKEGSN